MEIPPNHSLNFPLLIGSKTHWFCTMNEWQLPEHVQQKRFPIFRLQAGCIETTHGFLNWSYLHSIDPVKHFGNIVQTHLWNTEPTSVTHICGEEWMWTGQWHWLIINIGGLWPWPRWQHGHALMMMWPHTLASPSAQEKPLRPDSSFFRACEKPLPGRSSFSQAPGRGLAEANTHPGHGRGNSCSEHPLQAWEKPLPGRSRCLRSASHGGQILV